MTLIRISPQTLGQLLPECPAALSNVSVRSICDDHREINSRETLFFARRTASGRTFAAQALDAGAALVLADKELDGHPRIFACAEPAQMLARVISHSQGWSSKAPEIAITAVTGTNGKSSVTHLLAGLLEAGGQKTAVIGTLGAGRFVADGSGLTELSNTTPGLLDNWRWLIEFAHQGVERVVMEVSSHALDQHRVVGLPITTAVFTQISRDHLDYHPDFAAYQEAKLQLLAHHGLTTVVFDADAAWAEEIAARAEQQSLSTCCFSLDAAARADVTVDVQQSGLSGMHLYYQWRDQTAGFDAQTGLVGDFNARNLTSALLAASPDPVVFASLCEKTMLLTPPAGRMERFNHGNGAAVFVDYAHTPDALEQVLMTLRRLLPAEGKLVVVFGCGGERDQGKRPLMGAVAVAQAERVIITSDNPRGEPPEQIIKAILEGVGGHIEQIAVEPDRLAAIQQGLSELTPSDCLLVAGKGHEQGQIMADQVRPFDDRSVVRKLIQAAQTRTGDGHD